MAGLTYCYEYPRPAVTTDCVIFGFDGLRLNVLLIERAREPFKGCWAFPGGFLNMDETAHDCAVRELQEETGLTDVYIEQLYTFSEVDRDPRGRTISVAYYALVRQKDYQVTAGDDARAARWFPVGTIPSLAFDHDHILRLALERLKGKIRYQPIGFELLDEKFTLPDLQSLYEAILGIKLDRRNFYKKIRTIELLTPLDEKKCNVPHKRATYYRFDRKRYEELSRKGFNFEI